MMFDQLLLERLPPGVCCFDGQSELIRPLNRTFPLVMTRYWAIDLDAGCESGFQKLIGNPFGIFVRCDGRHDDDQLVRWMHVGEMVNRSQWNDTGCFAGHSMNVARW